MLPPDAPGFNRPPQEQAQLPMLEKGSKVWNDAIKYMQGGGNLAEIRKKYIIADDDAMELERSGK